MQTGAVWKCGKTIAVQQTLSLNVNGIPLGLNGKEWSGGKETGKDIVPCRILWLDFLKP